MGEKPVTRSRPQPRAEQRRKVLALMAKSQKRSKYRAVRCEVDGEKFDSQKEARRWQELKMREKAGDISELERQPRFPIYARTPQMAMVKVAEYRADFRYRLLSDGWPGNARVVEDVKSPASRTPLYRLKKRIVEAQYGISILET